MLRTCDKCNCHLNYLDNEYNDLSYLICPKCRNIFTDEKYITVEQRINQGYIRYERSSESQAYDMREKISDDDCDYYYTDYDF